MRMEASSCTMRSFVEGLPITVFFTLSAGRLFVIAVGVCSGVRALDLTLANRALLLISP